MPPKPVMPAAEEPLVPGKFMMIRFSEREKKE
jgi:hypothetical protein